MKIYYKCIITLLFLFGFSTTNAFSGVFTTDNLYQNYISINPGEYYSEDIFSGSTLYLENINIEGLSGSINIYDNLLLRYSGELNNYNEFFFREKLKIGNSGSTNIGIIINGYYLENEQAIFNFYDNTNPINLSGAVEFYNEKYTSTDILGIIDGIANNSTSWQTIVKILIYVFVIYLGSVFAKYGFRSGKIFAKKRILGGK